jgi:hypothetical protein
VLTEFSRLRISGLPSIIVRSSACLTSNGFDSVLPDPLELNTPDTLVWNEPNFRFAIHAKMLAYLPVSFLSGRFVVRYPSAATFASELKPRGGWLFAWEAVNCWSSSRFTIV